MTSLCLMSIFEIASFIAYDNEKQLKLCCTCVNRLTAWCLHFCTEFIDNVEITDDFRKVILHCDVISCVICI